MNDFDRAVMCSDADDATMELKENIRRSNTIGIADSAVALLEIIQPHMTDEERVELWRRIKLNYCGDCGCKLPPGCHCYCNNND